MDMIPKTDVYRMLAWWSWAWRALVMTALIAGYALGHTNARNGEGTLPEGLLWCVVGFAAGHILVGFVGLIARKLWR